MAGEAIHAFGENGELSTGARIALSRLVSRSDIRWDDERGVFVFPGYDETWGANLLTNPGYDAFPDGWKYQGSTAGAVTNSVLTVTGTGAVSGVGVYSDRALMSIPAGHKVYVRAEIKSVAPASSYSVSLSNGTESVFVNGKAASVPNPPENVFTVVSDILTIPSGWTAAQGVSFLQVAYQASAAAANGVEVELRPGLVIDLTEAYGAGKEPTLGKMDEIANELTHPVIGSVVLERVKIDKPVPATESVIGLVELATAEEVAAGTDGTRAITPATLKPMLDAVAAKTSSIRRERGQQRVMLRFDDGFASNLTIAAPHMAKYGMVGDLFTCTHPTNWLGTVRNGSPILTQAQLVELHQKYGWTIGSHTRMHTDAIATGNTALYAQELRDSIADLVSYGLPYPKAFVYPNGSRNRTFDRVVFRLFSFCGLVTGPLRAEANGMASPVRHDKPTFLTDWLAIGWNGSAAAEVALIDAAKRYIEHSWSQGISPIVAFHDIRNSPQENFDASTAGFKQLIDWIGTEGYPVGTVNDLRSLNEIQDPGFEAFDPRINTWAGAYPWGKSGSWNRVATSGDDLGGGWAMKLDASTAAVPASSPQFLTQRLPVESGAPYKTTFRCRRSSHTSGDIELAVRWYTQDGVLMAPVGSSTAGEQIVRTFAATAPTSWLEQTVTPVRAPLGAAAAQWELRTSKSTGFQGVFEVSWSAWYRGDSYDPFEGALMPRWA